MDWQAKAEDNERLRQATAEQLEGMRADVAWLNAEVSQLTADAVSLGNLLTSRDQTIDRLTEELAEAKAALAAEQKRAARLQSQLDRPARLLAKKVLRRGRRADG